MSKAKIPLELGAFAPYIGQSLWWLHLEHLEMVAGKDTAGTGKEMVSRMRCHNHHALTSAWPDKHPAVQTRGFVTRGANKSTIQHRPFWGPGVYGPQGDGLPLHSCHQPQVSLYGLLVGTPEAEQAPLLTQRAAW